MTTNVPTYTSCCSRAVQRLLCGACVQLGIYGVTFCTALVFGASASSAQQLDPITYISPGFPTPVYDHETLHLFNRFLPP